LANCIGYEAIRVGSTAKGPTTSLISGGVACAVFYADPDSSVVRYRPDGTDPTPTLGLPLRPGKSITVAGGGNIGKSLFVSEDGGSAVIHALYYDKVDIVDLGLSGNDVDLGEVADAIAGQVNKQEELLVELRRIRIGMSLQVGKDLEKTG